MSTADDASRKMIKLVSCLHRIPSLSIEEFQQHWAGTHFFNPPRYLKLVEVIPGPKTSREAIETLNEFCDRRLGKGVVIAKDTPNFIANRIGTFSMLNALKLMSKLGMTVEEVDACTGPAVGWPKSATFRTADLVGLDVLVHVVKNIYETAPNDESRDTYKVPPLAEEMVKRDHASAMHQDVDRRHGPHQRVFETELVPEIFAHPPALRQRIEVVE